MEESIRGVNYWVFILASSKMLGHSGGFAYGLTNLDLMGSSIAFGLEKHRVITNLILGIRFGKCVPIYHQNLAN